MAEPALDLFPDKPLEVDNEINRYCYWRLGRNAGAREGWIVAAPAWPLELQKRQKLGHTPLPEYGQWLPAHRGATDVRGVPFDSLRETWRLLFQQDGHKQMPVSQVIAYGWHLAPPYKGVEFPQMLGVEYEALDCPECNLLPQSDPIALAAHMRIRHEYTRQDLRAYSDEIGIDFLKRPPVEEPPIRTPVQMDLNDPFAEPQEVTIGYDMAYQCDECDWAPRVTNKRKAMALAGHKRMKHEAAETAAEESTADEAVAPEEGDSDGTPVPAEEVAV